ncbi:MAG: twin-arginine translocase TatA/TatE family subunit [Deltaproteobacteria bacterium]|jgi:sec-independent protein translocase protein TatB|nr:twin-arginine translocase TatA/TatE family subunit [Deltaproteobacteria bacterium]
MFGLSMAEVIVAATVALVLLGPDKLPKVMRALARLYAYLGKIKDEFNKAVEANLAPLEKEKFLPELENLKNLKPEMEKTLSSLLGSPQAADSPKKLEATQNNKPQET